MTSSSSLMDRFYRLAPVHRLERWFNAMPHPSTVIEIAPDHVAAAHWSRAGGTLESFAAESLPTGSVMPSPMETNVTQPDAVRTALRKVFARLPDRGTSAALLIPDPVARVFILPFETLPRRRDEALPLLRWRLKKSVPFDVEESVISWMRQSGRLDNLEVVVAIARDRIIREYEEILQGLDTHVDVVMSSTLATLPLLEETRFDASGSHERQNAHHGNRSGTESVRVSLVGNDVGSGKPRSAGDARGNFPRRCLLSGHFWWLDQTTPGSPVSVDHSELFCAALGTEMKVEASPLARFPGGTAPRIGRQEFDQAGYGCVGRLDDEWSGLSASRARKYYEASTQSFDQAERKQSVLSRRRCACGRSGADRFPDPGALREFFLAIESRASGGTYQPSK